MTVRFGNRRLLFYIAVFALSATVLGLAARFASVFLPNLHRDFTIFALIVPSLTIFTFLLTLQWAQPRIEAFVLFILWALWLAMGAWSTDVAGNVQCDSLGGQRTPSKDGDISAQTVCYEMKVIQAFSWMLFVMFSFGFIILLVLVSQAERSGRNDIWKEPIRELPWFGEIPGFYNTHQGPMTQYSSGGHPQYGYQIQGANGQHVMQAPGHSVIIQPGMNGQPSTITQVPVGSV